MEVVAVAAVAPTGAAGSIVSFVASVPQEQCTDVRIIGCRSQEKNGGLFIRFSRMPNLTNNEDEERKGGLSASCPCRGPREAVEHDFHVFKSPVDDLISIIENISRTLLL